MKRGFVVKLSLKGVVGMFLAIAPILDPYVILELGSVNISIDNIVGFVLMIIVCSKEVSLRKNLFLINLCFILFLSTIITTFVTGGLGFTYTFRPVIIWLVYSIMVSYLWKIPCRDAFFKAVRIISIFASVVILLQFVCGNIGIPMWDGRIPFFSLSSSDRWSGYIDYNAHTIRPCGIFQEASYAGMYLLVAYAQTMKDKKYKTAVLFAISMCLTASLFAVLGCIVITLFLIIGDRTVEKSVKTRVIVLLSLISLGIAWLTQHNPGVSSAVMYITKRITNIGSDLQGVRMSSTKMRLIGYLYLFEKFSIGQKLFGIGNFAIAFSTPNTYTSVLVYILLNYGLFGIIMFLLVFISSIFSQDRRNRNIVYYLIVLIVFAMDFQWFSWYFFYLLTPCFLKKER